jgi:hypothetical protein
MTTITKEEFFKHEKVSTRAKVLMHAMYSRDTDEIYDRFKEMDIKKFKFAESVYKGYQTTKNKTGSSLNYYCWVLSFKMKIKPPAFYKNWYLIYRHFCIRSKIDPYDLIGIGYKFLKYIAESGPKTMDSLTTNQAVGRLKENPQDYFKNWEYVKDLKKMRKELLNTDDIEGFTRKWFMKGLI